MGMFLPNYKGEGPTTISEKCGFHQVQVLDQGLKMVLFVTMHEPVGLTPLTRALVAVVALGKRLLNASFLTFSDSKCCLGGEGGLKLLSKLLLQ